MYILMRILLGVLALCVILAIKGPSRWDRLLIMNLISTKIIVIIIVFASINQTPFLMDFAIVYALSGFIGTIFVALFLSQYKALKRKEKKK